MREHARKKGKKRGRSRKNPRRRTVGPPAQRGESAKKRRALLTGRVKVTLRGRGFLIVDEVRDADGIEIPRECLNTALPGDTVEAVLLPRKRNEPRRAEVMRILERAKTRFVGTFVRHGDRWYVDPDDPRVYADILIETPDQKRAREGYKTLVALTAWDDPKKAPLGRVVEIIGKEGEHETEMRAVVLAQGFDYTFPPEVARAADALHAARARIFCAARATHRDLHALPTFTIDPEDAKDFDDALSVRPLEGGAIEVGVHIADVSTYVKKDDAIDKEAQERATSVYLVDRTIPMLPEVLSNDLCSLNPGEEKLAFSVLFTFTPDHTLSDTWFGKSIITSDKRFSYEEAQGVLDRGEGPFLQELTIARDIARTLRAARFRAGAISFETEEIKFKLDADMKPVDVLRKARQETNLLIEDWMLLANRAVAERISAECKQRHPDPCVCVYRVHPEPDPEKIMELAHFVEALGFHLPHDKGVVRGEDLNALFRQVEGTDAQDLVETAAIRSMAKAFYSLKNIGHFGLAFSHYLHFTSPIRRYPDLMVHRILTRVLAGKGTPSREYGWHERLAQHATEKEVAAMEAERDSVRYKQIEYLRGKVGQVFEGKISGITDWGIFVEELHSKAEGLVRLRDLTDDYYYIDKKGLRLVGQRTRKTLSLCDRVRVKLTAVDLEHKTLEWKLLDLLSPSAKRKRKESRH